MRKNKLILILLFLIVFLPVNVLAGQFTPSVTCRDTTVGSNTTCTISATALSGGASGVDARLSISGATIESVTPGNGWSVQENTTGSFLYVSVQNMTGSFTIATVNIRTNAVGTATLKVTSLIISDENFDSKNVGSPQKSFSIRAKQTDPPTRPTQPTTKSTAKPTTKPTTKIPTTSLTTSTSQRPTTTNPSVTTQPDIPGLEYSDLVLTSVKVDDFPVTYADGKYYATVNFDTEKVNIETTAAETITVIGGGTRSLAVGNNVVELVLRNEINQSRTVQVVITRPDDTNAYNTNLSLLKVVDYDIKFDKTKLEYTIYVPSSVKELFVIAESDNKNLTITGDGLQQLNSGKNDLYVKVQYGDKSSTNYVIHVKRNYMLVFMWVGIALLSGGLAGSIYYFTNKNKQLIVSSNEEKNKIKAEANRTVAEAKESVSLNGKSVITPTNTNVIPATKISADFKAPLNGDEALSQTKEKPVMPPRPSVVVQAESSEPPLKSAVKKVEPLKTVMPSRPETKEASIQTVPKEPIKKVVVNKVEPSKGLNSGQTQVIQKRVPTNPVTVATSTVSPKHVEPINQVKVVKKLERQPIKTVVPKGPKPPTERIVVNTSK